MRTIILTTWSFRNCNGTTFIVSSCYSPPDIIVRIFEVRAALERAPSPSFGGGSYTNRSIGDMESPLSSRNPLDPGPLPVRDAVDLPQRMADRQDGGGLEGMGYPQFLPQLAVELERLRYQVDVACTQAQ